MPPGQLDGGLVALGSRIAKERLVGAGVLAQPSGQFGLLRGVVEIGDVVELGHLVAHRLCQGGVRVAQGAGGDARDAVCFVWSSEESEA